MISTSSNVEVQVKPVLSKNAGAIVVFMTEGQSADDVGRPIDVPAAREAAKRLVHAKVVRGKAKEIGFDLLDTGSEKSTRRVYVVGLGPSDKITSEIVRQAGGTLLRAIRKHQLASIDVIPSAFADISIENFAEAIVTGAMLAGFDYREFKGSAARDEESSRGLKSISLTIVSKEKSVIERVTRARIIADGQNFARTIASRPGNVINPPALAKVAMNLAKQNGLKCSVLDEKKMKTLGMGGILAVGAGSGATPPRMIVLEYQGKSSASKSQSKSAPLLVVGKAITFDTGGISIKPADKMGDMIYDKSGGMAVLGMMYALSKLKLPINVIGILSSAENHISETAYRPGDIITQYNGVTVEVTNTDAEGRLVLADALAWGIETYKPSAVVDLATLTGGCIVALGMTMAGVMGNDDDLIDELKSATEISGEKIWRLPIGEDQREQIKSSRADIVNSAGRWASPLQGAAFVSYAIPEKPKVPWAHFDIAGVADTDKELPYYAKGSTGWGVRTLVEWVSACATKRASKQSGTPNGKSKSERGR